MAWRGVVNGFDVVSMAGMAGVAKTIIIFCNTIFIMRGFCLLPTQALKLLAAARKAGYSNIFNSQ